MIIKSGSISIITPSIDGNVHKVLKALRNQSLSGWNHVVASHTSPAARARNSGSQKATSEYLIFIDDDVQFNSPHALEEVVKVLKDLGSKDAINLTWRLSPKTRGIGRTLNKDALFTFDRSLKRAEMPWQECGAACFAIRADWFNTLNGYDEELISGEDCDLAYRIIVAGGTIYTLPKFWVEHEPPTTFVGSVKKSFWYERGNAQVARKHPESGYRINLDSRPKAVFYLLSRTVALLPLMFFRVNYRQRWPKLAFRPLETLFSYIGAWAYTREWLFPSNKRTIGTKRISTVTQMKRQKNEAR